MAAQPSGLTPDSFMASLGNETKASPKFPPMAPPPPAGMPLPPGLMTDEQIAAQNRADNSPVFVNPRTGRRSYSYQQGRGPLNVLDTLHTGPEHAAEGVEEMAGPMAVGWQATGHDVSLMPGAAEAIRATASERLPLPLTPEQFMNNLPPGTRPKTGSDIGQEAAEGLHKVIGGLFETATPAIIGAGFAKPAETVVTLGAGM